ncbi:FACT complex subunit SSRP1 [Andrographis paniculata]|uniref:FACT complex subunit SSRP1 n=1 Tax=Andrographis paniculata TaxID=175694 RepID=UPI0021E8A359|nr:FACT complex subunit SSRP1 [Andrographis paniculata]
MLFPTFCLSSPRRSALLCSSAHFSFHLFVPAMTDGHLFNGISLGGRGGSNPGQLRVHSSGIVWKKQGGGKAVEVDKSDLLGLSLMKVPRSNQLGVRTKDGLHYKFTGLRDQDVASLTAYFQSNFGKTPEEKQLSVSGKNWGDVDLNGNTLTFLVGGKQAFEISLADVAQTQLQGKNDVMLEFHVDDTTGANEKDSLMEISFHIPNSNTQFVGDDNHPSAQVFRDRIVSMADVGAGGEEAVTTFDGIAILTPRGRYNVELHLSFLRLQGQANDFKIQYSSVVRVFWLPKSNQPHTFVVITLDPPIRKGQTLYPHIVMQFETEAVIEAKLSMSEDLYNTKYKDKLKPSQKGLIHEIFIAILRGLSGVKVTKPGTFRSHQDGYAVKSSLKAEDGVLYPLEKSFFFLPKPPTLILHEEIDYVEFERHSAGGSNMHYFDLLIRLKTEQEHLFRNIQRNEYLNLFKFINVKGLKIMNLGGGDRATEGVAAVLTDIDDAVDPHLERIKNQTIGDESDEEDEDFVADKDDEGSPTDDSGEGESDASEGGEPMETPTKKKSKKEASAPRASSSRKKSKDGDEDGTKKKKQKRKKDPNAPKRAISAFMFFSQTERENLKSSNPGISFTEMARVLGERWNKMTAEEKAPYEARARADKKRYSEEISGYKNPQASSNNVEMVEESDSE